MRARVCLNTPMHIGEKGKRRQRTSATAAEHTPGKVGTLILTTLPAS
jgi:hypothetical protein